jgi:hypothetical protein
MAWQSYEQRVTAEWKSLLQGKGWSNEVVLQGFLEAHPSLVPGGRSLPAHRPSGHGPIHSSLFARPRLAGTVEFIPDFVWLASDSASLHAVMVEIETPSKKWFNANGRQSAALRQATDQLAAWKNWLSDGSNRNLFREIFRIPEWAWRHLRLNPQFVGVLGSRSEFQDDARLQRRRQEVMAILSDDIEIMTFDRIAPERFLQDTFTVHLSSRGLGTRPHLEHTLQQAPDAFGYMTATGAMSTRAVEKYILHPNALKALASCGQGYVALSRQEGRVAVPVAYGQMPELKADYTLVGNDQSKARGLHLARRFPEPESSSPSKVEGRGALVAAAPPRIAGAPDTHPQPSHRARLRAVDTLASPPPPPREACEPGDAKAAPNEAEKRTVTMQPLKRRTSNG